MCYSYEVSVITFLIGTILTGMNILLYKNNPVYVCISIVWFSAVSMQFWEALLWKDYKCKATSKIAMINNLIQPLMWLSLLFVPGYIKNNKINLYLVASVVGIYCVYVSKYFKKDYGCVKETNGIKLKWWDHIGSMLYVVTSVILVKLTLRGSMANYQSIIFIVSLLLGKSLVKKFKTGNEHDASVWCWVAAFSPLVNNVIFSNGV
jgi:hypothetical protein